MTSRISGPIPSHDVYLSSRSSLYSSRGMPTGSVALGDRHFSGSMNALNVLQWQTNSSSTDVSNSLQTTGHPEKNHIRENIRRLRQLQNTPPAKRVPYAASFVPISRPYKVSPESPPAVDALPPRPYTATPRCSHNQLSDRKLSRVKTSSTDTTTIQWPGDQGEVLMDDYIDDPTCPECHRPIDPEPLSRQNSRLSLSDQQATLRNAPIGVHCRGIQCSLECRNSNRLQSTQSQGVQAAPMIDQPTQTHDSELVHFIRRDINFVRANAHLATAINTRARGRRTPSAPPQSSPMVEDSPRPESSPSGDAQGQMWPQRRLPVGSLPTYLIRRRQEQREAVAKAAANQPDPDQPPGHQKMPEAERMETLKLLQKAHKELADEWGRLPIRMDTMRIRSRRAELEQRLTDLEQAISIFNKPKVFIRPE